MSKSIEEEVQQVLEAPTENITFEEPLDPTGSPLNQPVVENEIGHAESALQEQVNEPEQEAAPIPEEETSDSVQSEEESISFESDESDNVPEQEIGSGGYNEQVQEELTGDDFELPASHARQAADTILGMTDNVLAVGGGFFIKIKKHKEFYDFEEVIQVIDEQNEKNVKRLKLDEDDKILLRPLLISMLKRKAKKLTPEQQLLGAVLSILMKKAQAVMEIRAENEILVERILDVIREEKGYSEQDLEEEQEDEPEPVQEQAVQEVTPVQPVQEEVVEEPSIEIITPEQEDEDSLKNSVLEVADENSEEDKA